jgi:hypothetical protein
MIGIGVKKYRKVQQLEIINVPTEPVGPDDLLISIKASEVNPCRLERARRVFKRRFSV